MHCANYQISSLIVFSMNLYYLGSTQNTLPLKSTLICTTMCDNGWVTFGRRGWVTFGHTVKIETLHIKKFKFTNKYQFQNKF